MRGHEERECVDKNREARVSVHYAFLFSMVFIPKKNFFGGIEERARGCIAPMIDIPKQLFELIKAESGIQSTSVQEHLDEVRKRKNLEMQCYFRCVLMTLESKTS